MRHQINIFITISFFSLFLCSTDLISSEERAWPDTDPNGYQGTSTTWPNLDIDSLEVVHTIWQECMMLRKKPVTDKRFLSRHARMIFDQSTEFRNIPPLSYKGFSGPWIEQRWIDTFTKISFDKFSPWVPLFIQWTDYGSRKGLKGTNHRYLRLKHWIKSSLRKDVLYISVVQNDEGIGEEIQRNFKNILTISSGGYGYAKIPLLSLQQNSLPHPQEFSFLVSFSGSLGTHRVRRKCNVRLSKLFKKKYLFYEGENWIDVVNNTHYVVCPRGFGRTAFKLYETLDMQRVPIYVYDDIPWLPYEKAIDWASFSIPISSGEIHKLKKILHDIDEPKYLEMIHRGKELHHNYFTFAGVVQKIGEFIGQPSAANISCDKLPDKVR